VSPAIGGSGRLASLVNIPILGSLPFNPRLAASAEQGQLSCWQPQDSPFLREFAAIVKTQAAAPNPAGVLAA
jgi:hypothetical protein